jgi:hypothetical protein
MQKVRVENGMRVRAKITDRASFELRQHQGLLVALPYGDGRRPYAWSSILRRQTWRSALGQA